MRPPSIEAVRRILRIKFRLGLFEHPYADEAREAERAVGARSTRPPPARSPRARWSCSRIEGDVLPLKAELRSIAVLGPLADDAGRPAQPLARRRPGRATS